MKMVVKNEGHKEELDEGKLWNSIYYPFREAHYDEEEAVDLADEVKHEVVEWIRNHDHNVVTTKEIKKKVGDTLERVDEDVRFMYEKHLDIN